MGLLIKLDFGSQKNDAFLNGLQDIYPRHQYSASRIPAPTSSRHHTPGNCGGPYQHLAHMKRHIHPIFITTAMHVFYSMGDSVNCSEIR